VIVLTLSKCPNALRGDLTKWMFEIDTNVFVGRMSARVRDEIWKRVVEFSADGRAVLVYTVNNEQRFEFRTHNSKGEVVDLDGIKLFMKPSENKTE